MPLKLETAVPTAILAWKKCCHTADTVKNMPLKSVPAI